MKIWLRGRAKCRTHHYLLLIESSQEGQRNEAIKNQCVAAMGDGHDLRKVDVPKDT